MSSIPSPSRLAEGLRWRALRWADRHGRSWVRTVRSGPAEGLRLSTACASADYSRGDNERPVQDAVVAGLGRGDVFYDIGANVGFFSLLASRVVGPTGTVVALEPHPEVESAMRANLERNGADNVRAYRLAAASSTGRLGFAESAHPGGGSLEATGAPFDAIGHLEVDAVRLDDLVARDELPPPTLIKLDIESGELEALRGATEVVRSARPAILVELDAPTPADLADKRTPIEDWLRELGYDLRELPAAYPNRSWQVVHLLATAGTPGQRP